jgi:hypothetical protein
MSATVLIPNNGRVSPLFRFSLDVEVPIVIDLTTTRSKTSTAILIGYSEFTTPSTPPRKYRNQAISGRSTICYRQPGCTGLLSAGQGTYSYAGNYNFPADGSAATNNQTKTYRDSPGGGSCSYDAINFVSTVAEPQTFGPNDFGTGLVVITTIPTQKNWDADGPCGYSGDNRISLHMDCMAVLSQEDLESDAIDRANALVGFDGTPKTVARMNTRGAGVFSATYEFVEAKHRMNNLVIGRDYKITTTYGRRTYGSVGAFSTYATAEVNFTASAAIEESAYLSILNDSGFETNILSVAVVSI